MTVSVKACALLALLFAVTAAKADEPASIRPLLDITQCIPMRHEDTDAALCAVHAQGYHWFIAKGDATWGGVPLPGDPVSAQMLAGMLLSPGQRYLAISEASEGHPTATVIDFEAWLSQGVLKTVWRNAVYPGYIAISRWQGEMLVLSSDHDLTRADQLHLAASRDRLADREFLLDPASGRIEPMGPARP